MSQWVAGPRLFAIPGDVLNIVFRNNLNYTVNAVPSGAATNSTEAAEPGQIITYQWTIGVQVRQRQHPSCCSSEQQTHPGTCRSVPQPYFPDRLPGGRRLSSLQVEG